MKSIRLLALFLASGFLFRIHGEITGAMWKVKMKDYRYTLPGSVLVSLKISRVACGMLCHTRQDCISFNHNKASTECEILNTAFHKPSDTTLIAAPGWNYYNFLPPRPPKNASGYCPSGGIYVQYEQPVYKRYDFSIDGFACSPHQWVKDRHNEGKTCKMVIMYDTDFPGQDSAYINQPGTYYYALRQCMTYNCIGMICLKYSDKCWLKLNSQLTSGSITKDSVDLLYWYTFCE
ncbi:uncharacterized protein LOC135225473 [Macrobrachium nipponense]|uniref:uncharacterized protein LOC135225473 n=1 Tax=Macrobrachium nipponense TaxID=159736 RepID=UPI0030C82773